MPAPTVPFDIYVTQDVIPAELAAITVVNGFMTTVPAGGVIYPNWTPLDEAQLYLVPDSSLVVWNAPSIANPEDFGEFWVTCPILIYGIRRGPSVGLRDAAKFMNDVRRVMLSNATRNPVVDPGVANTWGVDTVERGSRPFEHLNSEGLPIYIFEAGYDVTVRWPRPKGY